MKYESTIRRHESMNVQVFAADRDEAIRLVREANQGFWTNAVTELLDKDEPGETHFAMHQCENCGKTIWDGDKCVELEDATLCEPCWNATKEVK